MTANLENRLRKLESVAGDREARMFIVGASTPEEGNALADELLRSGRAKEGDSIILTGVRAPQAP